MSDYEASENPTGSFYVTPCKIDRQFKCNLVIIVGLLSCRLCSWCAK